MALHIALLRAVNVGGTGKLPMSELKTMCVELGFANVQTYIASGNVVFESKLPQAKVKAALEKRLGGIRVLLRTPSELADLLRSNPFPKAASNKVIVIFLDGAPSLDGVSNQKNEELSLGTREIFVHYPDGQGQSKLKIPGAAKGTGRNLNTVAALAEMAAKL